MQRGVKSREREREGTGNAAESLQKYAPGAPPGSNWIQPVPNPGLPQKGCASPLRLAPCVPKPDPRGSRRSQRPQLGSRWRGTCSRIALRPRGAGPPRPAQQPPGQRAPAAPIPARGAHGAAHLRRARGCPRRARPPLTLRRFGPPRPPGLLSPAAGVGWAGRGEAGAWRGARRPAARTKARRGEARRGEPHLPAPHSALRRAPSAPPAAPRPSAGGLGGRAGTGNDLSSPLPPLRAAGSSRALGPGGGGLPRSASPSSLRRPPPAATRGGEGAPGPVPLPASVGAAQEGARPDPAHHRRQHHQRRFQPVSGDP